MKNRTWAEIDIDNLMFNIKTLKSVLGRNVGILAAVKANAYGHDSIEITRILSKHVSMFGVASMDEAIELRIHRIDNPILILSPTMESDINRIVDYNLMPNVVALEYAKKLDLAAHRKNRVVNVHVEIDTGMNRTGIHYTKAVEQIEKICAMKNIVLEGIFSHFAEAEKADKAFSIAQKKRYDIIIDTLQKKGIKVKYRHFANSSAIENLEDCQYNLVRPGIMIYGQYTDERLKKKIALKPVMRIKTRIGQIKTLKKGDSVSYGRTFTAKKEMRIATCLIGYADGYLRDLSNKSSMFVNNTRVKVIGNVCMDLTMIDISKVKSADVGDEVEVFGDNIKLDELARLSNTLIYEIMTGIGPRVPRVFIKRRKMYYSKNILATNGGNLV
ncbi:TPA: alanine racemase [candidate division WOR-3 bacterium]|jgi:alanine racemase|uniref:Alanine racemase n=1 Tax=candidate division WOR-3 bacterium TaxID=2052148 RepID=A0A350H8M5_UNCW3|nr:alanine racemase [candidate division WOR-3 bacterium]